MAAEKNRRKKFLGQHFLNHKEILNAIVHAADVSKKDSVLEVGPGHGALTEVLAKKAKLVITVEKDSDLIPLLKHKFRDADNNIKIIHGDILSLTPKLLGLKKGPYKIVANLPYYITSRFLRMYLSSRLTPSLMVLLVQREIAEKIIEKQKKSSLLSLSVKAYGTPTLIKRVPRGAFSPPPKVDSAILKISNISHDFFEKKDIDERGFFEMLKCAYQKKRKMLRVSLKNYFLSDSESIKRPENLNLRDWVKLYTRQKKHG